MTVSPPTIVVFDGVCALCDGFVQFVIDRDSRGRFVFAPLQSVEGRALLATMGMSAPTSFDPETIVVVESGRVHERSAAVLRVVGSLGWPWALTRALYVVPAFARDAIYRFVARRRYRWLGKNESCRVPTPELRSRFLENRPELLAAIEAP